MATSNETSILSPQDKALFAAALECQLPRSAAIQVLYQHQRHMDSNGAVGVHADTIVPGAFIRALAVEGDTKQYLVAQVDGVVRGEEYGGFSSNVNMKSTWYFRLRLPTTRQRGSKRHRQNQNDNEEEEDSSSDEEDVATDYDLTSISNSKMQETEFAIWLRNARSGLYPTGAGGENEEGGEILLPSVPLLMFTASRLQPFLRRGGGASASQGLLPPPTSRDDPPPGGVVSNQADLLRRAERLQEGGSVGQATTSPNGNPFNPAGSVSSASFTPSNSRSPGASRQRANAGSHGRSPPPPVSASPLASPHAGEEVVGSPSPLSGTYASVSPSVSQAPSGVPVISRERRRVEELMRRECIHQLSEQGAVFPRVFHHYRPSRLRLIERDLADYLQLVRDSIVEKRETCIICFERVPTVILYPCKHRVICRRCANNGGCDSCPVCRSSFIEMFEVEEV